MKSIKVFFWKDPNLWEESNILFAFSFFDSLTTDTFIALLKNLENLNLGWAAEGVKWSNGKSN